MQQPKFRGVVLGILVAMALNLTSGTALADPLPPIVTIDPAPAVTVTTTTTVLPLSTPIPLPTASPLLIITTTQPVVVTTTTTAAATANPLTGSVIITGPGTSGTVPITTTVAPGTIDLQPQTITVAVPTVPTVATSGATPITTTGTNWNLNNWIAIVNAAIQTGATGASATVTEPANGITVNAGASAAICLLANAVGRTTLDPAATASLSTLCGGAPSTASGNAGLTAGQLASTSVTTAAAICLVANALAVPAGLSSDYLASAGLDSRCGTTAGSGSPTTAGLGSTTTLLDGPAIDANGAAAICLLASAVAGLPTTADLATACGTSGALTPSLLSGGATGTLPGLLGVPGTVGVDLNAALCVVAHAVADIPTTATLTTACGTTPTSVSGTGGVTVDGVTVLVTPSLITCLAAAASFPGLTSLSQTCGTTTTSNPPTTTTTSDTLAGPNGPFGRAVPVGDLGDVRGVQAPPSAVTSLLGQIGITSLPSTATALGAGGLGLALLALGLVFLRRRPATH